MAIKKSELYSSLWRGCDELRGGMDASQYKDYVLVLLFVKYVSDKYAGQKNAMLDIPEGASFADLVALKGDPEIGDKMNKIISKLADANDLKGVIDQTDFNDPTKLGTGKEMVDRLSNLIAIFDTPDLDFRSNSAEDDDLLGDAYEYLMRNFATESGKSKGQFYTPAEVSRVMAKVIGVGTTTDSSQTIYDPTCGSGSLLLKAHDEAQNVTGFDLALYGQEMDNSTAALAKMNMILHGCPTAEIWNGNTLANPGFKEGARLKTFDFVVANPPFSTKAWSNGFSPAEDEFDRFVYGIPPAKNGDYAFLLHILASLKSNGKGAVILPHGVLFRGNAEAEIRKNIVRRGYIKGIIGLPPNLFYGTGIPACIIVLDKSNAHGRQGIFMIDASREFMKDGNKNRLRARDIHKIVDTFNDQLEIPKYSRMVLPEEIEANDFNLNIPRYIDSTEPEDLQDIEAHMRGGIPNRDIDELSRYWQVFPGVCAALFEPDRPGYSRLKVDAEDIKKTIFGHGEFADFSDSTTALFAQWKDSSIPYLRELGIGSKPKVLIEILSESLLEVFQEAQLIDPYDIYQCLMVYWAETMQDDAYMIATDGWQKAASLQLIIDGKGARTREKADFTVGKRKYKTQLIPPELVITRYFPNEQGAIEALEMKASSITQRLDELKEEHCDEEGLLTEVINDRGNITKGALTARLKEIRHDVDYEDEYAVLKEYRELSDQESTIKKQIKDVQGKLDAQAAAKFGELKEDEIKGLVITDKWLATLASNVQAELDRVSQALAIRIRELAERYATPLPELTMEIKTLSARVEEHLRAMGVKWE